jgi:hypothetical protein
VGKFKSSLMAELPGLYDPEYISFGYPTTADGGAYDFSAFLVDNAGSKATPILDRAQALRAVLIDEFRCMARDPAGYFGADELRKAKSKLIDRNLLSAEVAGSFVTGTLSFWWSVANTDYFFGYEKNCDAVSYADIGDLITRYILGPTPDDRPAVATAVRLNAEAYAADPAMGEREKSLGYAVVRDDNAFWWQK